MTPEQLQRSYAVPVLANVPVVQYGEGDFSYQGMRGLGEAEEYAKGTVIAVPAGYWPSSPWLLPAAIGGAVLLWWWMK